MLHFKKVIKTLCFPLVFTPFIFVNSNSNIFAINNTNLQNKSSLDIKEIENNYSNSQFNISFENIAYKGLFSYNQKLFTYGENNNELKNKLLSKSLVNSNQDVYDYKSCIQELTTGNIIYKNNSYQIVPNNKITRNMQYKKVCATGYHTSLLPKCGKTHSHTRSCMKTVKNTCYGCINTTENLSYQLSFNNDEFNNYFKMNNIDNAVFNFSKLIKIDYQNSFKSFNRNILKFKFNSIYLKSKIFSSFNSFYANYFYNTYKNSIDKQILDLLVKKIQENLITDYSHYINQFLNINTKTYGLKTNIKYWIEALTYKDKNQIITDLNKLKDNDISSYLKTNSDNATNNYLWYQLYLIFSNKELMKQINYQITYYTKLNSNNPIKTINIVDLYNNVNNDITYRIDNLNIVHNFEDQAIYVTDINLKTDNLNAYFNADNVGLINNDDLNKDKEIVKTPLLNNAETWIKYNPEVDINNIFAIKKYNSIDSKTYLLKNKFDDFSDIYKNDLLIQKLTNLKQSPYITLKDVDWLNNLKDDQINLSSEFFKLYVKQINLKHYLSTGTVKFMVLLSNQKWLEFLVDGFKIQVISFNKKYENIKLKDLDVDESSIDKEFVLNNLLSFNDVENVNSFGFINTTKIDFIDNLLVDLSIQNDKENIDVKLSFKDSTNTIINHQFNITKNNTDNNETNPDKPNLPPDNNNSDSDLDKPNDNVNQIQNNNSNNRLYWLISIPVSILILSIVSYLLFKRKRKVINNNGEK